MNSTNEIEKSMPRTWLIIALLPALLFAAALFEEQLVRMALLGVVVAVTATFVFLRPLWGVYLLVFYTNAGLSVLFPGGAALSLTAALLAAALVAGARGDANRLRDPMFCWALGFFLLASIHSMLYSHQIPLSLFRLVSYLKALLVIYLIVQFVRTPRQLFGLCLIMFFGACASILLGFGIGDIGAQLSSENQTRTYFTRFGGLHGDPNGAAAYMCAAIPMGIVAIKHGHRPVLRGFGVLGVMLLIAGVFATFSRGGLPALAVVVFGAMLREIRGRRAWGGIAVLVAAFVMLSPREYWDRMMFMTRIAENVTLDMSVLLRWRALRTAWDLFLQHPFTGIGIGTFQVRGAVGVWKRMVVHNAYAEVLVGTGIIGFTAFMGLIVAGIRQAARGSLHRWAQHPEWLKSVSFYVGLSVVSTMASALFLSVGNRYLIWVPVAACLVVGNLLRQEVAE